MFRIQFVLVSVVLLVGDGLANQLSVEQINGETVVRIDRSSGNVVRGNCIPIIDLTTFNVSRKMSLTAFDVAGMYAYYPQNG